MRVGKAKGATVSFRLAKISDAEYILSLRLNTDLNRYISPTDPSIQMQRDWLAEYKNKELAETEYYFIISKNANAQPCGTVRMYYITRTSFEWGSIILDGNKTRTAAIEAVLFIYSIAFDLLKLEKSLFTAHKGNLRAVSLYAKMNARIIGERQTRIGSEHLYEFDRENWAYLKKKFKPLLPCIG